MQSEAGQASRRVWKDQSHTQTVPHLCDCLMSCWTFMQDLQFVWGNTWFPLRQTVVICPVLLSFELKWFRPSLWSAMAYPNAVCQHPFKLSLSCTSFISGSCPCWTLKPKPIIGRVNNSFQDYSMKSCLSTYILKLSVSIAKFWPSVFHFHHKTGRALN